MIHSRHCSRCTGEKELMHSYSECHGHLFSKSGPQASKHQHGNLLEMQTPGLCLTGTNSWLPCPFVQEGAMILKSWKKSQQETDFWKSSLWNQTYPSNQLNIFLIVFLTSSFLAAQWLLPTGGDAFQPLVMREAFFMSWLKFGWK